MHVPINSGYENFYRALSTSAFSIMSGVNLGYGAPSISASTSTTAGGGTRTERIRAAMKRHPTPSHYVQLALAAHLRAYCAHAVLVTQGGIKTATLGDLIPTERGMAAKTVTDVEALLLAVAKESSEAEKNKASASSSSVPRGKKSATTTPTTIAAIHHPRGLFEYLSHWYGVMAAQSLAGVDIPEAALRKHMTTMRVLLQTSGATSKDFIAAASSRARVEPSEDDLRLLEFIMGGLGEGTSWPEEEEKDEEGDEGTLDDLEYLRKRAVDVVSQVMTLLGFPGGLCVVHPFPKSKFELFGPNTTWCSKQDRRRYSIREEDRRNEDKLAMMPLPSDVVDDSADINVWLPLVGIVDESSQRASIADNRTVAVTVYNRAAKGEEEASRWAKSMFAFSDAASSSPSGRLLHRHDDILRSGKLAYAGVIGIEKSASFEAPMHRVAVHAMIDTMLVSGIIDVEELQNRCSIAFPSDTEEFRDTEIILAQSSFQHTKSAAAAAAAPGRKPASTGRTRRVSARSVDEPDLREDASTSGDDNSSSSEGEHEEPKRRHEKQAHDHGPRGRERIRSTRSDVDDEGAEKVIRGALSGLEAMVSSSSSSSSSATGGKRLDHVRAGGDTEGADTAAASKQSISQTIKLRPKSPVPNLSRPRSISSISRHDRTTTTTEGSSSSSDDRSRWPSDFLKPEADIFSSKPNLDVSFDPTQNIPVLLSFDSLAEFKSSEVQALDSFCSKLCVFTTQDTNTPIFGISSREGMRVLMELMTFDKRQSHLLRITRPQTLPYGRIVPFSNVSLAEPSTIKGVHLLPEHVACICIASHAQISKVCELGAGALRAKEIIQEMIRYSHDSKVTNHFMGPGYEEQLASLQDMLNGNYCPTFRSPLTTNGYTIAVLNKMWVKVGMEGLCEELERTIKDMRAVIAVDDAGHDYPIIFRSSEFDCSRSGRVVQESDHRNASLKHLIVEGNTQGEYGAEVRDVIALSEYDGFYRVPTKVRVHEAVEIESISRPHRRGTPLYFFGLSRFQKEVIEATANQEIVRMYRALGRRSAEQEKS